MGTYLIKYADRAQALGAKIDDGINWTWANGFPTREAAEQFIREFPEMETRGVYPDTDKEGSIVSYSVRFRS
jgi:hypothetical protein